MQWVGASISYLLFSLLPPHSPIVITLLCSPPTQFLVCTGCACLLFYLVIMHVGVWCVCWYGRSNQFTNLRCHLAGMPCLNTSWFIIIVVQEIVNICLYAHSSKASICVHIFFEIEYISHPNSRLHIYDNILVCVLGFKLGFHIRGKRKRLADAACGCGMRYANDMIPYIRLPMRLNSLFLSEWKESPNYDVIFTDSPTSAIRFCTFCRMNRYMERFSLPHTQPFAAAR